MPSLNSKLNRFTDALMHMNAHLFVFIGTLIVMGLSIPFLYLLALFLNEPYGVFLFIASIILPLSITPIILYGVSKMLNRLNHFQEKLHEAVEENKRKEIMLYEQARFAFMGEMLSNISHQWRQPLNTINLAILSAKTEAIHHRLSDERMSETFELIETNSHYLSNTVDDFKSFFQKKETTERRALEAILKEVQSVIAPILKYHSITLEIQNKTTDIPYLASPLSQVILNIIGNSIDALKSVSQSEKKITLSAKIDGAMLEIVCCDNGCGIDETIKNSIFDPYFTTKSKSQGTGIGLYMSRQIVEKIFEGQLELVSAKESNLTCFKMRLHCAKEKDGLK